MKIIRGLQSKSNLFDVSVIPCFQRKRLNRGRFEFRLPDEVKGEFIRHPFGSDQCYEGVGFHRMLITLSCRYSDRVRYHFIRKRKNVKYYITQPDISYLMTLNDIFYRILLQILNFMFGFRIKMSTEFKIMPSFFSTQRFCRLSSAVTFNAGLLQTYS